MSYRSFARQCDAAASNSNYNCRITEDLYFADTVNSPLGRQINSNINLQSMCTMEPGTLFGVPVCGFGALNSSAVEPRQFFLRLDKEV